LNEVNYFERYGKYAQWLSDTFGGAGVTNRVTRSATGVTTAAVKKFLQFEAREVKQLSDFAAFAATSAIRFAGVANRFARVTTGVATAIAATRFETFEDEKFLEESFFDTDVTGISTGVTNHFTGVADRFAGIAIRVATTLQGKQIAKFFAEDELRSAAIIAGVATYLVTRSACDNTVAGIALGDGARIARH